MNKKINGVGPRLKLLREKFLRLSRDEMANIAGYSYAEIGRIERGEIETISPAYIDIVIQRFKQSAPENGSGKKNRLSLSEYDDIRLTPVEVWIETGKTRDIKTETISQWVKEYLQALSGSCVSVVKNKHGNYTITAKGLTECTLSRQDFEEMAYEYVSRVRIIQRSLAESLVMERASFASIPHIPTEFW